MRLNDLDLRLDPWEAEYGSELPVVGSEADAESADASVELPVADWRALPGRSEALPERLVFVDGVRRIDARIVVRQAGDLAHGAFGSYGVGAAHCPGSPRAEATFGECRVGRVLALGSGLSASDALTLPNGLAYLPASTPQREPNAPLARLQEEMRFAEETLAREHAERSDAVVICDGPLTFAAPARGAALGYVKRIMEWYVSGSARTLVSTLPAGWRSPLFALSGRRFARFAWFQRLADPQCGESELSGLVRLEVAADVGVLRARGLADSATLLLPRFAPSRGRDPRAPQNLLPIGALESHLRHLLGDARLLRRAIAARLAIPEVAA